MSNLHSFKCIDRANGFWPMIMNTDDLNAVKAPLELIQETNLDELMAHLCLMQRAFPSHRDALGILPDFSIHEGELESAMENAFHSHR